MGSNESDAISWSIQNPIQKTNDVDKAFAGGGCFCRKLARVRRRS